MQAHSDTTWWYPPMAYTYDAFAPRSFRAFSQLHLHAALPLIPAFEPRLRKP